MSAENKPGSEPAPVRPEPVDLSTLANWTGGDQALQREVIALFLSKSLDDLGRLGAAATETERREVAHSLVGSARAIGAGRVARLASDVERGAGADALADLQSAVAEARAFLSARLPGRQTVRA